MPPSFLFSPFATCAVAYVYDSPRPEGRHARAMHASVADSRRETSLQRMRGVPQDGQRLGASAALLELRPRRLLRFVAQSPRDETFPSNATSDRAVLRA